MKRIYIVLIVLIVTSCQDELNQLPLTSKVTGNFLKTETEVEEYVNATYSNLQSTGLYGLYFPAIAEIPSDNTFDEVPANDNGIYGQLDEFSTIPANDAITLTWRDAYQTIQKANVVLNRIATVSFKTEAVKQARVGEMKFIRALMYFNLVRLFGDVPLVVEETTDPNKYFGQGRTPASQVYDQIQQDLAEAITVLPGIVTQPGKVTKTAAQTLLAKVHLTLKNYDDAKALLDSVVHSNKHALQPKPSDVFGIANENNKEIIFAVQFASGINGNTEGSTMFQVFSPSGTQTGAKGHNLPTKSLYALYTASDLRKGSYLDVTPAGVPYSKKLTKPTTVITDGGSDVVVLRYADVLLMLAEVENKRSSSNPTAAAEYLDMVRARAGLDKTTAATQDELQEAIALERRLELIGEGHRWFDLLRTDDALTVMNAWFKANGKSTVIDKHHLVMPIPQSQINTDNTIIQNDDYR